MIDTDKYEGHRPGPWKIYYDKWNKTGWWIDSIARYDVGEGDMVCQLHGIAQDKDPTAKLIADAPKHLAEVKRLRDELDKQMEYIEWLEQFAPKAGEYNTSWEAYELAKEAD